MEVKKDDSFSAETVVKKDVSNVGGSSASHSSALTPSYNFPFNFPFNSHK